MNHIIVSAITFIQMHLGVLMPVDNKVSLKHNIVWTNQYRVFMACYIGINRP
jgi:hypothetical protein